MDDQPLQAAAARLAPQGQQTLSLRHVDADVENLHHQQVQQPGRDDAAVPGTGEAERCAADTQTVLRSAAGNICCAFLLRSISHGYIMRSGNQKGTNNGSQNLVPIDCDTKICVNTAVRGQYACDLKRAETGAPGLGVDGRAVEQSRQHVLPRADAAQHQADAVQRRHHEHGEGQQEVAVVGLAHAAVDPAEHHNAHASHTPAARSQDPEGVTRRAGWNATQTLVIICVVCRATWC